MRIRLRVAIPCGAANPGLRLADNRKAGCKGSQPRAQRGNRNPESKTACYSLSQEVKGGIKVSGGFVGRNSQSGIAKLLFSKMLQRANSSS